MAHALTPHVFTSHVFTYGSLTFDQVWRQVVNGDHRSTPAVLSGYRRYALAGRDYPGILACGNGRVEGRLWLDVLPDGMAALDRFEGDEYRRMTVRVELPAASAGGHWLQAETYLYVGPDALPSEWDPSAFVAERFLLAHPVPE